MNKILKAKTVRKAIALLLLLATPVCIAGAKVHAEDVQDSSLSTQRKTLSVLENDNIDLDELMKNGRVYMAKVPIQLGSHDLGKGFTTCVVEWLVDFCTGDLVKIVAKWGAGKLLDTMFSSDKNSVILEKMDMILAGMSYLQNQLGQIENTIVDSNNINQLNDFLVKSWSTEGNIRTIYGAMRKIDSYSGEKTTEEIARARKELMAYGATGISRNMLHGSLTDFDKDVMQYADALRKQYIVLFGNKRAELFEIFHQHLKNKYHWENQAYEEWESFQNYCMLSCIQSIWLDSLSLKARIEEIEDHNKVCAPSEKIQTEILEQRLRELDTALKDIQKMWDKNKIDRRKDNERYFWTPNKEMLLYVADDKYSKCPKENENMRCLNYGIPLSEDSPRDRGAYSTEVSYSAPGGMVKDVIYHPSIYFWRPFTMYDVDKNIRSLNSSEYEMIFNEYKSQNKKLYDIFFSEKEGNMPQTFSKDKQIVFIVDTDENYPLKYKVQHVFWPDILYCYAINPSRDSIKPHKCILCYYHNFEKPEPIKDGVYINIGVKKVGVCEQYSGYVED